MKMATPNVSLEASAEPTSSPAVSSAWKKTMLLNKAEKAFSLGLQQPPKSVSLEIYLNFFLK